MPLAAGEPSHVTLTGPILLALLDSGCRAKEILSLDVEDVSLHTDAVILRHTKSNKTRVVFLGAKACPAVARYLRHTENPVVRCW